LSCVFSLTHSKWIFFLSILAVNVSLCRASLGNTQQRYIFVVRFPPAHGKDIPCRGKNMAKNFFKKLIFVLLFISPLQKYYFVLYIFQSYTCLYRFTIFNNYVPVKQFLSYMSNLNCKCITE
jgi:hypothetical protein